MHRIHLHSALFLICLCCAQPAAPAPADHSDYTPWSRILIPAADLPSSAWQKSSPHGQIRAISPDRSTLALTTLSGLTLVDLTGQRKTVHLTPAQIGVRATQSGMTSGAFTFLTVALSQGARRMLISSGTYNVGGLSLPAGATLFDGQSGAVLRSLGDPRPAYYLAALSPDGRRAAAVGPEMDDSNQYNTSWRMPATGEPAYALRVWDTGTGQQLCEAKCQVSLRPPLFSPDGRRIVTFEFDGAPKYFTTLVRDSADGHVLARLDHGGWDGVFSKDGRTLYNGYFSDQPGGAALFPTPSVIMPRIRTEAEGRITRVAAYSASTGRLLRLLDDVPETSPIQIPEWLIDVSPNGKLLLTLGGIFDTRTGKKVWNVPAVSRGSLGFFSADSRKLYTSNDNGDVVEWFVATGAPPVP